MNPDHALTCFIELPGGRRVEVGMTVTAEPLLPTPNEPEVQRAPGLHEWADALRAAAFRGSDRNIWVVASTAVLVSR